MERHQLIEQQVLQHGRASVVDLARKFDVTTETVRRDLLRLERAGSLRRVHGGAVAVDRVSAAERRSTLEVSLTERATQMSEAKRLMATRALSVLEPGFTGSIFLDAGTSTAAIATALPGHLGGQLAAVEVVTHSMAIAHGLAGTAGLSLSVIGGRVRGLTAAAVGAHTVGQIEQLRPDVAFVGTNGFSAQFGASTPDPEEAAVKRAIVRGARRVVLLADSRKHDQELLVSFASLADFDVLVTDVEPTDELATALDEAGTEVWTA